MFHDLVDQARARRVAQALNCVAVRRKRGEIVRVDLAPHSEITDRRRPRRPGRPDAEDSHTSVLEVMVCTMVIGRAWMHKAHICERWGER